MTAEEKDNLGPASGEAREALAAQMDRLVDGELSETERRELLASLDATDEGWRQLALAYVEAQTWGGDFAALAAPAQETSPAKSASLAASAPTLKLVLAMAASFLVAIVVGYQFRDGGDSVGNPTLTSFTEPATGGPTAPLAESPLDSPNSDSMLATTDDAASVTPKGPSGPNGTPVFNVGSEPTPVGVTPAVPPNIAEMLRRLRHRVERRRSLVPVETEDGRRMFVPVEDIEVEYVGDDAYQ